MSKCRSILLSAVALLSLCGCLNFSDKTEPKIRRVFCWGMIRYEASAARYAAAGVTDIRVRSKQELTWAQKYGMTAYCNTITPAGPHPQVLSPEEEKYHRYINALDLPKSTPKAERKKIINQRRLEKGHRFGGDRLNSIDTLNVNSLPCFGCDTDFAFTGKKIDSILAKTLPGVQGIYMDYFGYVNHRGCYCKGCLERCQEFLKSRKLADTPENRDLFYQEQLIAYFNRAVDYVKAKRPDFRIVAHIYPEFEPNPLYGYLTRADYCGETVSWYFQWSPEKIAKYTAAVVNRKQPAPGCAGVPFIGVSTNPRGSLGYKSPADVEKDLQIILRSGGNSLMVCNGDSMITPGYFEVFQKYCSRQSR